MLTNRHQRKPICTCAHIGVYILGSPHGSDSKESASNAGGPGSIPGSERSPGEGHGNPLQDSCLENSRDRGAWQATCSPWGSRESDMTERLTHTASIIFLRYRQLLGILYKKLLWSYLKNASYFPVNIHLLEEIRRIWKRRILNTTVRLVVVGKTGKSTGRTLPVGQWLRIHLPMQGSWVWSLVGELRLHMLQGSWAWALQLRSSAAK